MGRAPAISPGLPKRMTGIEPALLISHTPVFTRKYAAIAACFSAGLALFSGVSRDVCRRAYIQRWLQTTKHAPTSKPRTLAHYFVI